MIKSERYGGGHRWYCTKCDVRGYTISWTNSYPPANCNRCGGQDVASRLESAKAAMQYLKDRYQERAVFPGSIRAIADLCEKHRLIPNDMKKTHFARLINEIAERS
jgi:hypothetical protein